MNLHDFNTFLAEHYKTHKPTNRRTNTELNKFMEAGRLPSFRQTNEIVSLALIKAEQSNQLEEMFGTVNAKLQSNYKTRINGDEKLRPIVLECLEKYIKERKQVSQLRSDICKRVGNWDSEWFCVAMTEATSLRNLARVFGSMWKTGKKADAITVARLGSENCSKCNGEEGCKDCNRLYLRFLRTEPKKFKLSDILGNCNFGLEPKHWKPSIMATHHFCSCRVAILHLSHVQKWDSKFKRFDYKKVKH